MPTEYLLRLALAVLVGLIIVLLRQVRAYRRSRRLLSSVIEMNLNTHDRLSKAIGETEEHNQRLRDLDYARQDDGK